MICVSDAYWFRHAWKGALILGILWSVAVAFAVYCQLLPDESDIASGMMLAILSYPSSAIFGHFIGVSLFEQVVSIALAGYLQWGCVGALIGLAVAFIRRSLNRSSMRAR
jgi:hypothetical protein